MMFFQHRNLQFLAAYYIYDLGIVAYLGGKLYILHHIVTLWFIGIDGCSPDYETVRRAIIVMKMGDILLHPYKLIFYSHLKYAYPRASNYTMSALMVGNTVLWFYFRVYLAAGLYPFHCPDVRALAIAMHIANIWWFGLLVNSTVNHMKHTAKTPDEPYTKVMKDSDYSRGKKNTVTAATPDTTAETGTPTVVVRQRRGKKSRKVY